MISRALALGLLLSAAAPRLAQATYSIAATDRTSRQVGGAVTSCVGTLDVGVVYGGVPGHGVVHAQASLDPAAKGKMKAIAMLMMDTDPATIITTITATSFDAMSSARQYGIVDLAGRAAGFTGSGAAAYKNDQHKTAGAFTYSVQGNILTSQKVLDGAAAAFESAGCDLADRLMAALLAGDRAGGDRRGRQSAALFVVKPQAGYGGFNDIWLDYRVDDDPDPVPRLVELLAIHRLYFGKSPADDQIPIAGEVATQLQRIMASLGYYGGPVSGAYDETTRSALIAFIGNENFEDRTDFAAGQIDRPVFDYLLRKFGG